MATPKQNYARQYQVYAQGIEPDLPANVRTYSIFNPDTGTWQRMTNGFRSPIPVQGQTLIPTQTPGIMLRPKTPAQTPVQTPLGASRRASPAFEASQVQAPVYTGGGYAEIRKPFPDPMADDDFLHESPRPEPKRNVNITVIPRGNANPNNVKKPVESASNQPTLFDNIALYNPLNIGRLLLMKGAKEAKPYVTDAIDTYNQTMQEAGNAIRNWGSGFMNWLQR